MKVTRLLLEAKALHDRGVDNRRVFVATQPGKLEVARVLLEVETDNDQTINFLAAPLRIAVFMAVCMGSCLLLASS